ncbi:MAG: type II toxin-antitoxin system VapC family toxin [Caulobacteraceae bacterium]|nr:type II toxin-antitoxin system VapC family toxin [Caulobacteraceae bacterium]
MTLVVDASALVAIGCGEPGHDRLVARLHTSSESYIAPANLLEAGVVLCARMQAFDAAGYHAWLQDFRVQEYAGPLGADALAAYLKFGNGRHRARLNLADCFAYALAVRLGAPLLFVGEDFPFTDIRPALQPT